MGQLRNPYVSWVVFAYAHSRARNREQGSWNCMGDAHSHQRQSVRLTAFRIKRRLLFMW